MGKEMFQNYILDEALVPVRTDVVNYTRWCGTIGCRWEVGKDDISDAHVSTVFLGRQENWHTPGAPPEFFETMVFGGEFDHRQRRYSTWDEARSGHEDWVKRLRDGVSLDDEEPRR